MAWLIISLGVVETFLADVLTKTEAVLVVIPIGITMGIETDIIPDPPYLFPTDLAYRPMDVLLFPLPLLSISLLIVPISLHTELTQNSKTAQFAPLLVVFLYFLCRFNLYPALRA